MGKSSKKEVRWESKSSFSQLYPKHELVIHQKHGDLVGMEIHREQVALKLSLPH